MMQPFRSRVCSCTCMCACINKKNFSFNKCFIKAGMWKIPGKIRFIWPSESRAEEETAWKGALWVLHSQSLSLQKYIKQESSISDPSRIHIPLYCGGVSPIGDYWDWSFLQCAPSILLLFSFSACPVVHLSGARANYYGNEWNGYQIFFLLHFTHPHICWCLHLLECWDEVFFPFLLDFHGSPHFSSSPSTFKP